MTSVEALDGAVFSRAEAGNLRDDLEARRRFSEGIGVAPDWATVRQVHGSRVLRVSGAGVAGEADALWTTVPGLPIAVFTADCFGVVLRAEDAVGVAHAGWRGVDQAVVGALRQQMTEAGFPPVAAALGPGIRRCCFEVGPDVASRFPRHLGRTRWGSPSVDLASVLVEVQLATLDVWDCGACTYHDPGWFSHRASGDSSRMVTLGWIG